VQSEPFQRLRRIKQLGFSDLIYPGATHTRFTHCLGTLHMARRLIEIIQSETGETFNPYRAQVALAAALLHDVGHGPFSHAFEFIGKRLNLKMARHENVTQDIILNSPLANVLKRLAPSAPKDVAGLIKGEESDIYSAVVSSQFDADRLDYMQRDRMMTGTQTASLDLEWLMANLTVGDVPYGVDDQLLGTRKTFVLGSKAIHAAESYVLGLFQLYPDVYLHKATRSAERMLQELMLRVATLIQNGDRARTGLPAELPLVRFMEHPNLLENMLKLDDTSIWATLAMLADSKDADISALAKGILNRHLYKAIDIRTEVSRSLDGKDLSDEAALRQTDKICAAVLEELAYMARMDILPDEGSRSPYKMVQESKGGLNQILVKTPTGKLEDLGLHSRVVRAIKPYKFARAYYPRENDEAKKIIQDAIARNTSR
jgi:HD superfamily phosphohydrolase